MSIVHFPTEIWEKISYNLAAECPKSLCLLSKASPQLQNVVDFVVGHYEAHLHITFPKQECCNEQKTSSQSQKVELEMILNRKARYRHGKPHCHSQFECGSAKIEYALDDILRVFSQEIISLQFNNFPEDSNCFVVFNKYNLPKCDNICFDGSLTAHNGVYDLFQSCPKLQRLVISKPPKEFDFSKFWPHLKGSSVEVLDLMCFHHSSIKEFKLPRGLNQLFFCPKKDVKCDATESLATFLYSGNWNRVYIHSDDLLSQVISKLYKPLTTVREFCFSATTFAINYVVKFIKRCENLKFFNWYGLHSCVAPIVIARLLNTVSKNIVFGGCVACKGGQSVGNGGFMEVGNRIAVVQVTNLLERPEFQQKYGCFLDDAVLFEKPNSPSAVMYIQKKDSHCGPNCVDIHEISEKAGLTL